MILEFFNIDNVSELALPLISNGISAGFPSPALDFMDMRIDLNQYLIQHPTATFYGRVKGQSMKNAGIDDGDLLVIDKSIRPVDGKIGVCFIDGEFTLKRIKITKNEVFLMPENEAYQPIRVTEEHTMFVWGIVTYVIKRV